MKTLPGNGKVSGFTLIEVLVVIAVLAVLAAFLLPGLTRRHDPTQGITCMNNQKQICLGLIMWDYDNDNQFPWQRSTTTNGTLELIPNGHAAAQLQALADYNKSFSVYVCPQDKDRVAATDYDHFADTNTSYFVNVDATNNAGNAFQHAMNTVLIGDRQLVANGHPVPPGLFYYKNTSDLTWARGTHAKSKFPGGVLSFADGHSEIVNPANLNAVFRRQGLASDRLEVP